MHTKAMAAQESGSRNAVGEAEETALKAKEQADQAEKALLEVKVAQSHRARRANVYFVGERPTIDEMEEKKM